MNAAGRANDELPLLLGELVDGQLEPAAAERLTALLRDDPSARTRYLQFLLTDAMLRLEHAGMKWSGVGGQGAGTQGLGTSVPSGLEVESRESRVESETIVASGEWRVASEIQRPRTQDLRPKFPNLQTPAFYSPLSTLHYWAFSYSVATVLLAIFLLGAWSYTITHPDADSLATTNSRGGTTSRETANTTPEFTFVGRVSGMVDCQWSDESTATSPGAAVALNRRYSLKSGLMEITYDSGAKVILQGPCDYKVESPRGGFLKVGKLTAKVESRESRVESAKPQAAIPESPNSRTPNPKSPTPHAPRPTPLFSVHTPTALIEDLGTEFGVEVLESGETASHVFQGRVVVRIERAGDVGRETGDEKSELILSAGQSARIERDGDKSPRIVREEKTSAPVGFAQHMPRRVPIELWNTGCGVNVGEPDSHWQLVARSDQPNLTPRAAVVTECNASRVANDPKRSQWISIVANPSQLPEGVVYTFRSTFELPDGAYLDRAIISGRFWADDHVEAIRLNGKKVDVPFHECGWQAATYAVEFNIREGFVKGKNVLEFDVLNFDPASGAGTTTTNGDAKTLGGMEFRVELMGSVLAMPKGVSTKPSAPCPGKEE